MSFDSMSSPPVNCFAGPVNDDMFHYKYCFCLFSSWSICLFVFLREGAIIGPANTPFEGGMFRLSIHFPTDYPWKPPKITYVVRWIDIFFINEISCLDLRRRFTIQILVQMVLLAYLFYTPTGHLLWLFPKCYSPFMSSSLIQILR